MGDGASIAKKLSREVAGERAYTRTRWWHPSHATRHGINGGTNDRFWARPEPALKVESGWERAGQQRPLRRLPESRSAESPRAAIRLPTGSCRASNVGFLNMTLESRLVENLKSFVRLTAPETLQESGRAASDPTWRSKLPSRCPWADVQQTPRQDESYPAKKCSPPRSCLSAASDAD